MSQPTIDSKSNQNNDGNNDCYLFTAQRKAEDFWMLLYYIEKHFDINVSKEL